MEINLVSSDEMSEEGKIKEDDDIKKLYEYVIDYFKKTNPNPTTELKHKNGYELLVATILSAQTTDKRVNMVTPALFDKYPTPEALAKASPDDVYKYISGVNYAGNKSDYLVRTANILVTKYNGKIPENVDELQRLPGVGRKTANVVAATLFNKQVIAVDTHVMRVANRIGLVDAEKPIHVEEQLFRYTPNDVKPKISHWLILHGRYICTARAPMCPKCGINTICRYYRSLQPNVKSKGA